MQQTSVTGGKLWCQAVTIAGVGESATLGEWALLDHTEAEGLIVLAAFIRFRDKARTGEI
jgi:hypothetical protein